MFYVFSYTPVITDTAAAPHEIELKLGGGVIHQVDFLFQLGCNHQEFIQVFFGGHQLWPSNRGEKIRGDATVISFREFLELKPGGTLLTALIWTTLSASFKEVIIQIGVLPKEFLVPLSLEELLGVK